MSILNVEHLTHGFGDRAIFEDVSFRLLKGEHIGLVGANGEGKSTFMSIVTGKLMPDEGKVEWAKNVHAGYLDQHAVLEKGMTIGQVLKSAFDPLLKKEERMNEICDRLGTADSDEMDGLMEELGMFQYGGGGYHCVYFEDEDFEIFRKRNLTAVTNPASNLKLASGIAPIDRFIKEGINLAIGTDGPASNNCLDMFREMFLTTGLAKVREKDAACVGAEEVLYMATTGGAVAMGLNECDSLAEGKKADLIMLDLKQPNMQPENNLVRNIVYSGSKQNVKLTMVNGQILYEDNTFQIGFEPEEIYRKANEIIGRMK